MEPNKSLQSTAAGAIRVTMGNKEILRFDLQSYRFLTAPKINNKTAKIHKGQ